DRGLDLRRAGDAEEDDLRLRRERRRRARLGRARGEQVGDALAVAVHGEGERVALAEEVLRHAVAHEARGADESDLRHASSPVVFEAAIVRVSWRSRAPSTGPPAQPDLIMDTRVYPNPLLFINGEWRAARAGRTMP